MEEIGCVVSKGITYYRVLVQLYIYVPYAAKCIIATNA